MKTETNSQIEARPVVYDFASPALFLRALLKFYRRSERGFSIRAGLREHQGCSPALVSLMLQGKRRVSRDILPLFAQVFRLTTSELLYLDGLLSSRFLGSESKVLNQRTQRLPRNHLLSNWVNVYVKDCIHLKGFQPNADSVFRLLGGLAPLHRIQRAIKFLYCEGFWRKTPQGQTILEESAVFTTSGLPSAKIRQFHKAALEIAKQGLERLPPGRRKAYATVISVNKEGLDELRTMVDQFHKQLQDFIEKHPDGNEQLCQVVLHFTPLGGQHDTSN